MIINYCTSWQTYNIYALFCIVLTIQLDKTSDKKVPYRDF